MVVLQKIRCDNSSYDDWFRKMARTFPLAPLTHNPGNVARLMKVVTDHMLSCCSN
jgi:hypothetical protein